MSDHDSWASSVSDETYEFRDMVAKKHRAKSRSAQLEGDASRHKWHAARVEGQYERFIRVANCGTEEIGIRCNDCMHEMTQLVLVCGQWRVCVPSRARRAAERRAMFRRGREDLLRESRRDLRDRFLTLTLPHSSDIRADIKVLPALWTSLRQQVTQHLIHACGVPKKEAAFPFVRVIEVTAGRDRLGHAHLHVWMLSPYIHHELFRLWWGRAMTRRGYTPPTRAVVDVLADEDNPRRRRQLERALVTRRGESGRQLELMPWPVIDIRACHGDVDQEFIKYLVKDAERTADGGLAYIDPKLFAAIYEGLEGIRTIQASTGFWQKEAAAGDIRCCSECGNMNLSTRRRRRPADADEAAPASVRSPIDGGRRP